MKTVKFEIQELFSEPLTGNPELVTEERIKRLQQSVLRIAELMDIQYQNKTE